MAQTATVPVDPHAPAGAHGTTTAEGGAHGGVFPPLDSSTFPSQIFWLVIFFSLLYLLMSKWVLPKIGNTLQMRSNHIENDLSKARALQSQTAAAVESYEKALADARANAQNIAQTSRKSLQDELDAERVKVEADLQQKLKSAEASITATKQKALADVNTVAAESAMAIVEQLTGHKVSVAVATKALAGKA